MKLQKLNYLRVIAVISLVIWHCFFCPILCWNVIDRPNVSIMKIYSVISRFFMPDANMPLFTFISGYLFSYLLYKGKYLRFRNFFINKSRRLLIPFFVLGTIIPFTSFQTNIVGMRHIDLIYGEGSHMWYVIMLFWCFILEWIIIKSCIKYKLQINVIIALFSLTLYILFGKGNIIQLPLGIHNTMLYYGFFVFGGLVFRLDKKVNYKVCAISYIILYIVVFLFSSLHIYLLSFLLNKISSLIYVLALYYFIAYLVNKNVLIENKLVNNVCTYSFGIYVFHHWIAWNFYHFKIISSYLLKNQFILPFFSTVIIFLISYYLTKISLKTKIGRILLA